MRSFVAGLAIGTLVLTLGALAYLEMGLTEIHADASPAGFTSLFLYSMTHASVRRRAPVQSNPLQGTNKL